MRSAVLAFFVVLAGCYEAAGSGGRGEEALGLGEPGEVHTLASSGEAGHVAFEGEGPGVAGDRVSFAGDVDGDGYDEVIITDHSYRAAGDPSARGAVYLVYGRQTWDASEPLLDEAAILECDD